MGIFDFLKKKDIISDNTGSEINSNNIDYAHDLLNNESSNIDADNVELEPMGLPEILEDVFIEKSYPQKTKEMNTQITQEKNEDINVLYDYLEQSFEKQGYEDAMMNPDIQNMNENIENIKSNLFVKIAKVKRYYSSHIRNIDFHIETRRRNGLIDTVDELSSLKDTAAEELEMVVRIEEDAMNDRGLSQSLFTSYKKGFKNGLSTISFNSVLKRK